MQKFRIHHLLKVKVLALLLPAMMWFVLSGSADAAEDRETPASLAGGKVIGAAEAKKLVDAKGTFFVDTRSPVNFGKGHVPTAVSIAYREKSHQAANFDASADQFDLSKLPGDKNAKIVFYSHASTGWKSYKGAVIAIKGGYKNVMYMRGGYAEWTAKGFPEEK